MAISQSALAWLCLYGFLLGIALGAVYDFLRITRAFLGVCYSNRAVARLKEIHLPLLSPKKERKKYGALSVIVFLQDFLFMLFSGVMLILLFYEMNNGKFRFLAIICTAIGFLLYHHTLGRLVMLFSQVIVFLLETAFRYTVFFVCLPFRIIGKKVRAQIGKISAQIRTKKEFNQRLRTTKMAFAQIALDGCGMTFGIYETPKMLKKEENRVEKHSKRKSGADKKETPVQFESGNAHFSGADGARVAGRVRKQRHVL